MKLVFIGAAHEVTGSCTYINACGKNFLVDFGMEQGIDVYEKEPPLAPEHPLLAAPNCVLVPHVGYATREAFDIRIDIILRNLEE